MVLNSGVYNGETVGNLCADAPADCRTVRTTALPATGAGAQLWLKYAQQRKRLRFPTSRGSCKATKV